ncbi:F-box only protein 40 [Pseudolycoriella hygida]|uniref:F-box only protein 40 n=1 Tax=Pseudolycoriella hygida TaxID=35572 RepID=A0A9Q0N1K9_9DIPT|nr:F-box only protein 40 [Pseudolycoriella hygida]
MHSHSHCDNCFKINCAHASCEVIQCRSGCEHRMHECKLQDHLDVLCPRVRVPCINSEFGCNFVMFRKDLRAHLERCAASVVTCRNLGCFMKKNLSVQKVEMRVSKFGDYFKQQTIKDDSSLSASFQLNCGDNGSKQIETRQVCDSDFRRDEYCSHYRNVHCDIINSLNGWMEKHCPNKQYGCSFSSRQMEPIFNNSKTRIVFSNVNKAFGLIGVDVHNTFNGDHMDNEISLTDLPVELISYILSYLDSFSLNNISLTNKFLRSLCSSLLERRGLVSLMWKKNDTMNWTVSGHRWKFSHHFSLVEKWQFDNREFLNHFSNDCKHFDKLIHKEPFRLIVASTKN